MLGQGRGNWQWMLFKVAKAWYCTNGVVVEEGEKQRGKLTVTDKGRRSRRSKTEEVVIGGG